MEDVIHKANCSNEVISSPTNYRGNCKQSSGEILELVTVLLVFVWGLNWVQRLCIKSTVALLV